MYTLRKYQIKAVDRSTRWLETAKGNSAGILVLPPGSGKSLIIANIISNHKGNAIIFQPSQEILEQNLGKLNDYGYDDIGIYSAGAGSKTIKKITLSTIASIYKDLDKLEMFNLIIIDESHLVGADKKEDESFSMYKKVIEHCKVPVIGLTATPFRTHSNAMGTQCKIQTRTRPRVFKDIIHITQIQEVFQEGFLSNLIFDTSSPKYDLTKLAFNGTGSNFTEASIKKYNEEIGMANTVVEEVQEMLVNRRNTLVFVQSIAEAEQVSLLLQDNGIETDTVTSKTKLGDREEIIRKYKNGETKAIINVGTMTTGFDFPDLRSIIIARPIVSLSLWIQITGRGLRINKGKPHCVIKDLCGTYERYGNPLDYIFVIYKGDKFRLRLRNNKNYLTGVFLDDMFDVEEATYNRSKGIKLPPVDFIVPFGKKKGMHIKDVDAWYVKWVIEHPNYMTKKYTHIFQAEYNRRRAGIF